MRIMALRTVFRTVFSHQTRDSVYFADSRCILWNSPTIQRLDFHPIRKKLIQKHVRPKPFHPKQKTISSTTFIQKRFHPMTLSSILPKTLNPTLNPKPQTLNFCPIVLDIVEDQNVTRGKNRICSNPPRVKLIPSSSTGGFPVGCGTGSARHSGGHQVGAFDSPQQARRRERDCSGRHIAKAGGTDDGQTILQEG